MIGFAIGCGILMILFGCILYALEELFMKCPFYDSVMDFFSPDLDDDEDYEHCIPVDFEWHDRIEEYGNGEYFAVHRENGKITARNYVEPKGIFVPRILPNEEIVK